MNANRSQPSRAHRRQAPRRRSRRWPPRPDQSHSAQPAETRTAGQKRRALPRKEPAPQPLQHPAAHSDPEGCRRRGAPNAGAEHRWRRPSGRSDRRLSRLPRLIFQACSSVFYIQNGNTSYALSQNAHNIGIFRAPDHSKSVHNRRSGACGDSPKGRTGYTTGVPSPSTVAEKAGASRLPRRRGVLGRQEAPRSSS